MNYLSVENLSKAFGERKLFSNISFGIAQGQKIALVGINGAGKSTLMKIIMGLEIPDTGQVALNQSVKIAYVHQNPVFEANLSIYQTIFDQSNSEILQVIESYHKAMLDALAKGDEVVVGGGVIGRISKLGDSLVHVEVAEGVEIQVQRPAIVQVLPKGTFK
jgi:preprotein translocase YajC subunit